ncbi:hypothetical protein BBF93_00225 [Hyphomonas sp. CACIAM 19H1]|uniref:hypothetical protein n=1 Tax=Hyphomonas sp. CACIAM 19H1 TaxID=1873716 RepID=UPI000DED95D6|nr:hypothetical protein [Hyphomonas sp. CACIAM 19H1]AXE62808.1 hypothetical protein BBF93_00225 [Hyphomonas sp. CACIAM 19H1]
MKIQSVATALRKHGLDAPQLAALKPDRANYKLCLLQPTGDITYDPIGVRHTNAAQAAPQFAGFLNEAIARGADLAITPEYSMPWDVLTTALKEGRRPSEGKLWALGCESIRYEDLIALRDDLSPIATFIFDDVSASPGAFLDPLAYVFWAPPKRGKTAKLVVLVQFKTEPMSDPQNFEVNHLKLGQAIYQFGDAKSVTLTSFICSDVLKFDDSVAAAVHDRGLILHIQLNPNPRHTLFRAYRDKLLGMNGDATELICLNWASGVSMSAGSNPVEWNTPSNSAWYLKPEQFNRDDAVLEANHQNGLYYTYARGHRLHALFFNYAPALFELEATKVAHIGQTAIAKRTGPNLKARLIWNGAAWELADAADDGFGGVVAQAGAAQTQLQALSTTNPVWTERLLALTAGSIGHTEDWHCVKQLDSCAIDQNEFIRRMTFCQDTDQTAVSFRSHRLKLCGHLVTTVQTTTLPPALADLSAGFELKWRPDHPHQNAFAAGGDAATVIYMGETATDADMRKTRDRLSEFLRRSIPDPQKALQSRQRLTIWYRDGLGQLQIFEPHTMTTIDDPKTSSPLDFAREK